MPTQKDIQVWVGNDSDIVMKWWGDAAKSVVFDFGGSEIIFKASWRDGSLVRTTSDGGVLLDDPDAGCLTIPITPADTRLLPSPGPVRYEIERRIGGKETTIVYGVIKVSAWSNADE